MTRRLATAAAVLTCLLVALVGVAGPADAAARMPPACDKVTPTPADPYLGGALASNVPTPFPQPGDPFVKGSTTTILEQYGTAGTSFETYDTGCTVGSDIMPRTMTAVANMIGLFPHFAVSLTASLGNWVLNPGSWLPTLDAPIDTVSASLFHAFTEPFMPVLLLVAALALVYSARRMRWSQAFTTLAVAMLGMTLVYLGLIGPSKVTHLFDGLVQTGVSAAMAAGDTSAGSTDPSVTANPGTRLTAPMWEAVAYDQWVEGELGSSTSATAVTYGPRLFKAHTMSWDEARRAHQSAAAMQAMVDAKKTDWDTVAGEVQAADPAAYDYLTGNRGWERVGSAVVQWFLLIPLIFPVTALGMVLFGYLIFRYVGAFLPVLGALVVIPRWHSMLRTIGSLLAAAVVNTVIFAAGGAAVIAVTNSLLRSTLPRWLTLLIVTVMTVAAWMLLKPFRSLTKLVSDPAAGLQGTLEAPGNAWGAAKKFAGKAAATATGMALFNDLNHGGHGDDGDDGVRPELVETPQGTPTAKPPVPVAPMPAPVPSTYTQEGMGGNVDGWHPGLPGPQDAAPVGPSTPAAAAPTAPAALPGVPVLPAPAPTPLALTGDPAPGIPPAPAVDDHVIIPTRIDPTPEPLIDDDTWSAAVRPELVIYDPDTGGYTTTDTDPAEASAVTPADDFDFAL